MTTFVVLVTDDDLEAWPALSEAERQPTYDADGRFVALLAERGARVVGRQELAPASSGRVLTDGPYAESTEQLSGFYVVEAASLEDVAEPARAMLTAHRRVEVRPAVVS